MLMLLRIVFARPREVRAKANTPLFAAKAENAPIACLLNMNPACLRTCIACGLKYINSSGPERVPASLLFNFCLYSVNASDIFIYTENARRFSICHHHVRVLPTLILPAQR